MEAAAQSIIAEIKRSKIDLSAPLGEEFYYSSLPLCVIDAVFSMGVNYGSVKNVIANWCDIAGWNKSRVSDAAEHSVGEFLEIAKKHSSEALAINIFKNRQRTSTRSGILKAEAAVRFADVLHTAGIMRFGDMPPEFPTETERQIRLIPGQKSGISFRYFLMLAGDNAHVKPDRMIVRFVTRSMGSSSVSPEIAAAAVACAARVLSVDHANLTSARLDYAIWRYERDRT